MIKYVYTILGYLLLYKHPAVEVFTLPVVSRVFFTNTVPLTPIPLQPLLYYKPCCNDVTTPNTKIIAGSVAKMLEEAIPLAVKKSRQLHSGATKDAETSNANSDYRKTIKNKDIPGMSPSDKKRVNMEQPNIKKNNAAECAKIVCLEDTLKGPVCACNHKTGNTVSFKNECDLKKHNCRFDTAFKTILNEICPWEFESRRGYNADEDEEEYKYEDRRYYN